jgi:hypothetical protein
MATQPTNCRPGESPFHQHAARCRACGQLWVFAGCAATAASGSRIQFPYDCHCAKHVEAELPPGTRIDSVRGEPWAECFADNLPLPEQRKMAERAVQAGVGSRAGEVQDFSVVAPGRSWWQVQIRLKGVGKVLYVDVPETDCTAVGIERRVREALGPTPPPPW